MKFNFNKGTYTDCLSSDKYSKTRIEEPSGLRTSWKKFATLLPPQKKEPDQAGSYVSYS